MIPKKRLSAGTMARARAKQAGNVKFSPSYREFYEIAEGPRVKRESVWSEEGLRKKFIKTVKRPLARGFPFGKKRVEIIFSDKGKRAKKTIEY